MSGKFLKDRRQGHLSGANRLRSVPLDLTVQQEASALEDDLDLLEVVQAPDDFSPLGSKAFVLQSDFEFPLQAQSQERTEHMPPDRLIALVVKPRPGRLHIE